MLEYSLSRSYNLTETKSRVELRLTLSLGENPGPFLIDPERLQKAIENAIFLPSQPMEPEVYVGETSTDGHEQVEQSDAGNDSKSEQPVSRRRRATAEATETEKVEPAPENEASPSRRRSRRGKAAPSAESQAPASSSTEKAETRSRRRRSPQASEEISEEISDLDVNKAAARHAVQHGPEAVYSILEEFGVARAVELPQKSRREFLDRLEA